MLCALSARRNYSMRTDSMLTINNITQYGWMKCYYLTGYYNLQNGIDASHHGSISVGASNCPSMSWSTNDLPIDILPSVPQPEDYPDEETIDPQMPDQTCTPDGTKMRAPRQVVGVDTVGGKANGKPTVLYNKHRKYSEQWIAWHPFQSTNNVPQAQTLCQQTTT